MKTLVFGDSKIEFEFIRKNVKNININIRDNGSIMVSAPHHMDYEVVENFIYNNAYSILEKLKKFERTRALEMPPKEFISGEEVKFLGKQYRLKLIKDNQNKIYFKGNYLYLHTNSTSIKIKEHITSEFYRQEALKVFENTSDKLFNNLNHYNIEKPKIEIRKMTKRWGSCQRKKKTILLNIYLITAPMSAIEYVILHELIHFIHHSHDKDFYNLLTAVMPDWFYRKKHLDEIIVLNL